MPAPSYTIKVKVGSALMERIENACGYLEVSPARFLQFAIENELHRQEVNRIKEEIALEEIRQNILGAGQTISFGIEEDEEAGSAHCQLCLKRVARRHHVDGPLLCDECYRVAKGGDLETVRAKP